MKANFPIEAASGEQINKYFLEQQEVTEQMLKILEPQENATTSEIMGCKESIKNFREAMKQADTKMEQLSYRDVCYNHSWKSERALKAYLWRSNETIYI